MGIKSWEWNEMGIITLFLYNSYPETRVSLCELYSVYIQKISGIWNIKLLFW